MESTSLSECFSEMREWPTGDAALGAACGWLQRLSDAPFVALYLLEPSGNARCEFRTRSGLEAEPLNPELVREFLKRQITQKPGDRGRPRVLTLGTESREPPVLVGARYLSFINVAAEARAHAPVSATGPRGDRIWIFVGTEKAPAVKDELLLIAYSEHLEHLGDSQYLGRMVQLRNQFLSIASHELKTPLTSIYGMLQLQERMLRVKRDEDPGAQREKQHAFLKMVIRQVERLNELIDGLLDVSRIQAGRFAVEPAETEVSNLLKEVTSNRLATIANDAGVRLSVDTADSVTAWVDPLRMEEVITNLVMNAIRFSPEGGAVWIKLGKENGAMRLTVRDQGPAVPLEDHDRIFQPFERAQRTSRLGGLGLGLFISRQIAQLHGGNVSLVESIPGKGNVFEAYFPVRSSTFVSA